MGRPRTTYPGPVTGRFESWLAGGGGDDAAGAAAAKNTPKRDRAVSDVTGSSVGDHPGQRFGLPAAGPGCAGSLWRRLVALLVDCVLALLVTSLFVRPGSLSPAHVTDLNSWSLFTWFLITVLGTAFFAATPGMVLLGLRVARVDGAAMLLPLRAAVRAVLVAIVVPAVIWDGDRRGLHDRAAGTIVVAAR